MIFGLFRQSASKDAVHAVYSGIVAQSRQPQFYAEWEVPDTVTGRFDMISLHLALLFRRLRGEGKPAADFSQAVFDLFFRDMDNSLREMGVGDLSVPKKIKKMGQVFYGLLASLDEAMAEGERAAVTRVLVRNVYGDRQTPAADRLADYVLAETERLSGIALPAILAGRFTDEAGAGAAA